jgi:hypothetical protein
MSAGSSTDRPPIGQIQSAGLVKTPVQDGEFARVFWPRELTLSTAFPPAGSPGDVSSMHELAGNLGVQWSLRTRTRKRKNDKSPQPASQLIMAGPIGSVLPFYRWLRFRVGQRLGSWAALTSVRNVFLQQVLGGDVVGPLTLKIAEESIMRPDDPQTDLSEVPAEFVPNYDPDTSDDDGAVVIEEVGGAAASGRGRAPRGATDDLLPQEQRDSGNDWDRDQESTTWTQFGMQWSAANFDPQGSLDVFYFNVLLHRAAMLLQDAPFMPGCKPSRAWWVERLIEAQLRSDLSELDHKFVGPLVFCMTCLGRGKQALLSLLLSIVLLFPFRKHVRFALLLLGADEQTWAELNAFLFPAFRLGLLVVGSGGDAGTRQATALGVHGPGEAGTSGQSLQKLQHWHSSIAKNGAHELALFEYGTAGTWLCNMDSDNLVPFDFVAHLFDILPPKAETTGVCVRCGGDVGLGMTGRMVYRACDYVALRGYDQEGTASGGQDLDLRDRLEKLAVQATGYMNRPVHSPVIRGWEKCGCTTPNDWEDISCKQDRGWAKVKLCNPTDLQNYAIPVTKIWAAMNAAGCTYYKKLLREGVLVRNTADVGRPLGPWWSKLSWTFDGLPVDLHQGELLPSALSTGQTRTAVQAVLGASQASSSAASGSASASASSGTALVPLQINVVYTGLKRLWFLTRTKNTYPQHLLYCIAMLVLTVVIALLLH